MQSELSHPVRKKTVRSALFCIHVAAVVVAAGIALAAQVAAAQWSTVDGNPGNTRYSSLAQINAQNVTKLGAAWMSEKVGPAPSTRAMPVIDGDLMFFTAPPYVVAVNIDTGKIAWRYRTTSGEGGGIMGPPGSPAREGVAVGGGLVYVGLTECQSDRAPRRHRRAGLEDIHRRSGARAVRRHLGCAALRGWIGVGRLECGLRLSRSDCCGRREDGARGLAFFCRAVAGTTGVRDVAEEQ